MKTNLLKVLCMSMAFATTSIYAQVEPNLDNLKHFYNFEIGTDPYDLVGGAHGTLDDDAVIQGGILDLTGGEEKTAYLSLPAEEIAINTYSAVTIEVWAKSDGESYNMLWSLGQAGEIGTEQPGYNYLFFTPGRWGIQVAARQSVGDSAPWDNEDGLAFDAEIKEADQLYHYVLTIDADRVMKIYVDGELLEYELEGETLEAVTTLSENHILANLSNESWFIGRCVYAADNFWKGKVELYAIWDAALSADEVKWLFDQGEKRELPEEDVNSILSRADQPQPFIDLYAANNMLFVKNVEAYSALSVSVFDIRGAVVFQTNNFRNGESLNLLPGVYVVRAKSATSTGVQKIVIQ